MLALSPPTPLAIESLAGGGPAIGIGDLMGGAPVRPREPSVVPRAEISDLRLDRSFYHPGECLRLQLCVDAQTHGRSSVLVRTSVRHLNQRVDRLETPFDLVDGKNNLEVSYDPPAAAPRGYGLDVEVVTPAGRHLASGSVAFDVLERWTQSPRYGFLSDFFPGRDDAEETMAGLARFHINGLQFYDWMYRHEQFFTDEEPYLDPLGRLLSRATVEALIAAGHKRNIAAMPYTAIYAASLPFYQDHPDWALYQADGQPHRLGEDFLIYMDPRPHSPWMEHLLAQFRQILLQTEFDGIHLDQYGDPKQAHDSRGRSFDLAKPLAEAINRTSETAGSCRPGSAVIFNAVNNWPIELVAPSAEDLVYIEVWPPHTSFEDLHNLVVGGQRLGGGKPVVLAAYLDPTLEQNARLVDAVIFASGGTHIELGERDGMLAEAYFPRYQAMSPDLTGIMRRYYDFAVRYQDVIGPRTAAADRILEGGIEIEGVKTSPGGSPGSVWPIAREGQGFLAISLVNLLGLESAEWAKAIQPVPAPLGPLTVCVLGLDRKVGSLWHASPDADDPSPRTLVFQASEADRRGIVFQLPSLACWDVVVIEWSD